MAFSDFTLKTARERFGLTTDEETDLFAAVPAVGVPDRLRETLENWAPAALAMNTEKARSEFIIAPALMEVAGSLRDRVRLFSGVAFDVDKDQGLNGACDFLLTRSTESFYVSHPVLAVIEAKKEDIIAGLGQCVAAMVAARIFNEREGAGPGAIYGVVTTGSNWRFLKLDGPVVFIDVPEYYIHQMGKILGILLAIAGG